MQIAPHTSLPCVSAWMVTCGPGRSDGNVQTNGTPVFPACQRSMSGNSTSIGGSGLRASTAGQLKQTWSASRRMKFSQRAI